MMRIGAFVRLFYPSGVMSSEPFTVNKPYTTLQLSRVPRGFLHFLPARPLIGGRPICIRRYELESFEASFVGAAIGNG
jgi:hypothetical protein